jgi:hypothetical protein
VLVEEVGALVELLVDGTTLTGNRPLAVGTVAPTGNVNVAGTAGTSAETEDEVTFTVAVRALTSRVDGGRVTCTRVRGIVTSAVVDGTSTVALMDWPWSPTPKTVTACGVVVATSVTGGVNAVSVTASWCSGGT